MKEPAKVRGRASVPLKGSDPVKERVPAKDLAPEKERVPPERVPVKVKALERVWVSIRLPARG